MNAHYIRFNSQEDFDLWHAEMNAALGLPNQAEKTERYTYCFTATDSKLYAPVNEQCPPELLDGFTFYAVSEINPAE